MDDGVVRSVNTYMMVYVMVAAAAMLLVSIDNLGFDTTISSVVACLNNIGPGFDLVGPTGNYGEFSVLSKLVLSATMMLGRLEMFPIILLFSPSVWRRSR